MLRSACSTQVVLNNLRADARVVEIEEEGRNAFSAVVDVYILDNARTAVMEYEELVGSEPEMAERYWRWALAFVLRSSGYTRVPHVRRFYGYDDAEYSG